MSGVQDIQVKPKTTILLVGAPGSSVIEEPLEVVSAYEQADDDGVLGLTAFDPNGDHYRVWIPKKMVAVIGEITAAVFERGEAMRKQVELQQRAGPLLDGGGLPPGGFQG